MVNRPKLQRSLSVSEFRDAIAAHAAELDRWIELSVDAFPSDKLAKAERLKKVRDPKIGFRFFCRNLSSPLCEGGCKPVS